MAAQDYATVAEVKLYAGISGTDDDTIIASLITDVSREIDKLCHRHFYSKTETRYYDFQDHWRLVLDTDLISVATFTNGDGNVLVLDTDFYAYPLNGPPYRRLYIRQDVGKLFQWSGTAQKAISIAGTWGYLEDGETPYPIRRACRGWCTFLRNTAADLGISREKMGDYEIALNFFILSQIREAPPGDVALIIREYTRRNYWNKF